MATSEEEESFEAFSEEEEETKRDAAEEPMSSSSCSPEPPGEQQVIPDTPEAVEDFLRNFLRSAGMTRTLWSFEAEWYGSVREKRLGSPMTSALFLQDAATHRQLLLDKLLAVRRETQEFRTVLWAAPDSLQRLQRESDFLQLQQQRVTEEKERLAADMWELKDRLQSCQAAIRHLDTQLQQALRQRAVSGLPRTRITSDQL